MQQVISVLYHTPSNALVDILSATAGAGVGVGNLLNRSQSDQRGMDQSKVVQKV